MNVSYIHLNTLNPNTSNMANQSKMEIEIEMEFNSVRKPEELLKDNELVKNVMEISKMMDEIGLYKNLKTINMCCEVISQYVHFSEKFKKITGKHLPIITVQVSVDELTVNLCELYNVFNLEKKNKYKI